MPSSPSHPSLERISNLHHLTISTFKNHPAGSQSEIGLLTKKKKRFQIKNPWNFGEGEFLTPWVFCCMFFFGSAMIETLRGDRISGVTRTTWTKALGVIDHPKLINSNTEYDTIIVHTYSSVYSRHMMCLLIGAQSMLTLFGTSLPSLPSLGRRLFTL